MTEAPSVLTKADLEHLRGLAADPGRAAAFGAKLTDAAERLSKLDPDKVAKMSRGELANVVLGLQSALDVLLVWSCNVARTHHARIDALERSQEQSDCVVLGLISILSGVPVARMADIGARIKRGETPGPEDSIVNPLLLALGAEGDSAAAYIARGETFRRRLREALAGRDWSESEPAASESTRVES